MANDNINIRYEHQNNSNYLVIEDAEQYEDYEYKMLKRNKPEHFLKFSMYSVNGKYGIYYDITSRQQLSKFYEYGKMTMEDVKSICFNISEMARIADDYMLDIDHVKIEPKYIYMDVGTKRLHFIYHTRINNITFNEGLKILFEFILEHFDHSLDKESIVKLYEVYQKVLVGDYDPYNLMRMFGMIKKEEQKLIRSGWESNKDTVDEPETEIAGVEDEKERLRGNLHKETKREIPTVIAEQMLMDTEEKISSGKAPSVTTAFAAVVMIYGILCLLVPDLVPAKLPALWSVVCICIGAGLIYFSIKKKTKDTVVKVESQAIPYTIKGKPHNDSEKAETIVKEEQPEEKRRISFDDVCNETMLLSDYNADKKKTLKLIILNDNLIGDVHICTKESSEDINTICMEKNPYVIGSLEKMADVIIKAQVISRMHCCIYHESFPEDVYMVEDLNATNGTYVNGERLENHERRILKDGDILKLAVIAFKVEIS